MQRITKPFWSARHEIWNADLLLYRGGGLIPIAGRGEYSHAAMAGWWAGIDPVPNLNDRITEPNDLARSSLFEYRFTLEA
jgi:hypothetical protein